MTTCLVRHAVANGTFRCALSVLVFAWLSVWQVLGTEEGMVDFNFQIRPLLSDRCFKCHGPDERARKAKLRLDKREGVFKELEDSWAVVKPGHPERSEMARRIFATDEDDLMPPPASNLKLSPAEKDLLQRWIAQGAEYKPHWSLIPVEKISPPKPHTSSWLRNPIDQFVLAKLEEAHVQPAPEASRETLIRRLALNLTGLPPKRTDINSFLADHSPDALERVVERYLNSPAYGERMALDWLDLARYADTYGYQSDVDRDMSPWRDWVIRAFNENLPYDQFITWQIAGDLLPNATRDQRLATAFNRLHRQTNEGGSIEEEFRAEYASDRVNTVGTAMLGLTLGCARCHDHKYDPIAQRDYYSLTAFFNNIDESGLYSHFTRATPTPGLLLWPEEKSRAMALIKLRMTLAEERLTDVARDAEPAFRKWQKAGGRVQLPEPIARFTFDMVISNATPDGMNATNFAKLVDGPKRVAAGTSAAITNFALQFSGDNELTCESVREFKRTDPFSFSLWLKPTEKEDRAVILHQSRAWTDSGSRGYELVLEKGRPFFGLIHFWPGNAIAVRAKKSLPLNEWSQVVVAYDGSSRAAGIHLYLNGQAMDTETVRDHLYKDIVHRKEWNDMEVGQIHLTLAGRFRDHGFKNGLIDDFQVFDVCLTAPEVKKLSRGDYNEPLTLTLSPREREQQGMSSQNVNVLRSADRQATILPLPKGEGRGEGESNTPFQYFLTYRCEAYRSALAELKRLREQENELIDDVPEIMVMQEMSERRPTYVLKRGAYDAHGEQVQPDAPASVMPFPANQPRNRLGFAKWLTDRRNPLTARVAVNRIWKMHFGAGLVATPEDFGGQGRLPTHPKLLDWLAGWFMDNSWDVKALHRLIVTSATFRQSSQAPRELVERDSDNRLLARGPKFRLTAEQIRDEALAASGLLNRAIGGPSVKPYQPEGLWEQSGTGKTYTQDHGDKLYRRSLYTFWRRTAPPPSMLSFDATTREVCTARRETTTTPLQALVLMNDPQFVESARVLSEKLLKEQPGDLDARIRAGFQSLTGRQPDKREIAVFRQLFDEQKAFYTKESNAADKLLATGESEWDKSLPRADFAATTMLVSAIMNFDEFEMER